MLEMVLAMVYPCTEFEVSTFTRSRFTGVGLKLHLEHNFVTNVLQINHMR